MRGTELALALFIACSGAEVGEDGRYAVSTLAYRTTDDARERRLDLRLYAPTASEPAAVGLGDLADPERREPLDALLAEAPVGCPTTSLRLAADEPPRGGRWPLVVYSHCHECLGLSGASVARRLASHGIAVLTVDHHGNTLWEKLDGSGLSLAASTLDLREEDVRFAIDFALDGGLGLRVDPERIGVAGHSFGAATAARLAEHEPRVKAALAMGAPLVNPLLPGVDPANITVPVGLLVAVEDNSITELGNDLMRADFEAVAGPAVLVEVEDAGHWSFSDLNGAHEDFLPGCGEDTRQTNGEPFTYLEPEAGRRVAADVSEAFFRATLLGDVQGETWLNEQAERR